MGWKRTSSSASSTSLRSPRNTASHDAGAGDRAMAPASPAATACGSSATGGPAEARNCSKRASSSRGTPASTLASRGLRVCSITASTSASRASAGIAAICSRSWPRRRPLAASIARCVARAYWRNGAKSAAAEAVRFSPRSLPMASASEARTRAQSAASSDPVVAVGCGSGRRPSSARARTTARFQSSHCPSRSASAGPDAGMSAPASRASSRVKAGAWTGDGACTAATGPLKRRRFYMIARAGPATTPGRASPACPGRRAACRLPDQ